MISQTKSRNEVVNHKIVIALVVSLLLVGCIGFVSYNHIQGGGDNMEETYQGPVPQRYDLEHFRKTGKTIKEDLINGNISA